MSNNVVVDVGFDIGTDKTENTYFKLRLGRGAQEVATLRQEVATGTGQNMGADKYAVCIRFPEHGETETLTEMVDGLIPGDDAVAKHGNWWVVDLQTAAGDGEEGQMFKDVEGQVNDFFAEVESNAFVEFGLRSAYTFEQALETAKANGEAEMEDGDPKKNPSFMGFMNSLTCHMRMDVDHEFAVSVMKFANKLGAPVTPEFYEFVRKFNSVNFRVDTLGFDGMNAELQENLNEAAWEGFMGNKDMFSELSAFRKLVNDVKLVFLLKDDTYLQLEVKLPGLEQYIEYFAPEE